MPTLSSFLPGTFGAKRCRSPIQALSRGLRRRARPGMRPLSSPQAPSMCRGRSLPRPRGRMAPPRPWRPHTTSPPCPVSQGSPLRVLKAPTSSPSILSSSMRVQGSTLNPQVSNKLPRYGQQVIPALYIQIARGVQHALCRRPLGLGYVHYLHVDDLRPVPVEVELLQDVVVEALGVYLEDVYPLHVVAGEELGPGHARHLFGDDEIPHLVEAQRVPVRIERRRAQAPPWPAALGYTLPRDAA